MSGRAADDPEVGRRLKEILLEREANSALTKLTHKDDCAFKLWPGAGCSCGAAEKNL